MVQYTSPRLKTLKIKIGLVYKPKKIKKYIRSWSAIATQEKKWIKRIIWTRIVAQELT